MEKTCTKCGRTKGLDEFGNSKHHKGGCNPQCKECVRANAKAYHAAHREELRVESLRRYHAIYAADSEWKKRRNAAQRVFNADYMKRPEVREKQKVWSARYHSKLNIRVSKRLSFQVWFSLRKKLDGKGKGGRHWEDLVGWTVEHLMVHLESRFEPGMTWANYGGRAGWQIDHVTPRTWFDITSADCEGFRRCWELGNLQPKWLRDNASKGNRFSG